MSNNQKMPQSSLTKRRIRQFKANKRGFYSSVLFVFILFVSLFANFIANDKPLLVYYKNTFYTPVLYSYPETSFGGTFETEADYREKFVQSLIEKDGWMLWPPIRYGVDTVNYYLEGPAPSPPSFENLLGTDDQGRDVLARLIHGYRISLLFGLSLTFVSIVMGLFMGGI